ncbi:MAG TPA: M55 family metallopeptidase [Vicinamibacterales bacterium]|nr:M55 family metallopeptidase [Vicinamibacterales bacterium]
MTKPLRFAPVGVALLVALPLSVTAGRAPIAAQAQPRPLKVFISVDMEGLSGVVAGNEVSATGPDYGHFRAIMAAETNAAIEGAALAGMTEFVVRDSHGNKTNLLPADVSPKAQLIRGASTGPKNMMEGIDATFAAAVFIGYHAKAGTPNAVLAHTSTGNVIDFEINGVSLPEAGYNALVAGLYDVPVVFVAGDKAFVDQARSLLGPVEAVATKAEIGGGAISGIAPAESQRRIKAGVELGIRARDRLKPYKMTPPYSMVLKVRADKPLYRGAERPRPGESVFRHADLLEVLNAFNAMK